MEKLNDYQGFGGRLHQWRENLNQKVSVVRDRCSINIFKAVDEQLKGNISAEQDYSHIYRHKSRKELIQISAAVMGIEFSYAAETAFVSPTLLKIGVKHKHMTLVWALSPLIGFFLCPILGSISDRCKLNMGRRRPFIILLSIGVFIGLLLVPNGEDIGYFLGDDNPQHNLNRPANKLLNQIVSPHRNTEAKNTSMSLLDISENTRISNQPWAIFFTVLGTILLDFDADACQSPSRAYLLEVCPPEDHAKGLSTFTIMAGLGGFFGYSMGGINWDATTFGRRLGGHVKAVFTIITVIFVICVSLTITSFKEIPLWALTTQTAKKKTNGDILMNNYGLNYGSLDKITISKSMDIVTDGSITKSSNCFANEELAETTFIGNMDKELSNVDNVIHNQENVSEQPIETLSHYLLSIIYMPYSLRMVCLTNLFCWMAHVCYSLYFTDFVGEAVFNGNPRAIEGSEAQILYEDGVRFGCWGMAMYSLSCASYSFIIEYLIRRFRAKKVYIGGLFFYCTGMMLMAITQAKVSVILFSWTAGVMYSTLFTLPYLLVAHYHNVGTFELNIDGTHKVETEVRGLGTDVAIVSSMVFLAQFILSISMGTIVSISGTTTAVVGTASVLSFCGAISATQIMYLDL